MSELSNDIVRLGVMENELNTLKTKVENKILNITNKIFKILKGRVENDDLIYYDYSKRKVYVENYTTWSDGEDSRGRSSNPEIKLSFEDIDLFENEQYLNEYIDKLKIKMTTITRRKARLNQRKERAIEQAKRDEMLDIAKTLGIIPTEKQLDMLLSLRT